MERTNENPVRHLHTEFIRVLNKDIYFFPPTIRLRCLSSRPTSNLSHFISISKNERKVPNYIIINNQLTFPSVQTNRIRTMKHRLNYLLMLSLSCVASFMTNPSFYARKLTGRQMMEFPLTDMVNTDIPSTIFPLTDVVVSTDIPSAIGTSLSIFKANELAAAPGTPITFTNENIIEAQVYGDIAHLILDLGTIYAPDTILLRLLIFLGRICSILSDYVPDHSMTFDEIMFQSVMLTFSTSSLLNKLATFTSSLTETTTFQDKRVFVTVFSPAGFTWMQYKTLLARNIIEWSHCEPGTFLSEDNESLLVTYRGQVNQFTNGNPFIQYGSMMNWGRRYSYDIIGDFSKANELLRGVNNKAKNKRISGRKNHIFLHEDEEDDFFNQSQNPRVLQVGKTGALLLRINTKMLLQHTNEDDGMTESTMNLYFSAMRKMLTTYSKYSPPTSTGDPMFSNNSTSSSNNSSSSSSSSNFSVTNTTTSPPPPYHV